MRRGGLRSIVCLWMTGTMVAGGCGAPTVRQEPQPAPSATEVAAPTREAGAGRPAVAIDPEATTGVLTVQTPDARAQAAAAPSSPLSGDETRALLARLEPLPDPARGNAAAPALRPSSAPPPRPGPAQPIAFVVPTGKPVGDAPLAPGKAPPRPLAPPQISPSGEIRSDTEIRIRFDEPMVAVAAVGTPATAPATIAPSIAGSWRWIDSRVVAFTAAGPRLPQATEITVTVPAGTRALSGNTLAAAATGTFSTRPVTIIGTFPIEPRFDSPIAVKLDQDVDPARLAKLLRFEDGKHRRLAWRPVSLAEARALWRRDPSIHADAELGPHVLIAAPRTAWPTGPTGSEGQVVLAAGAPSREGPRLTTAESYESFNIAPSFTVLGVSCDDMEHPRMSASCSAKSWLAVELSSPIEPSSYRAGKIRILGEPFEDSSPSGGSVGLYTPAAVGRTFSVAIAGDLVDVHGQQLAGARQPSFTVTRERFGAFVDAQTGLYVLDPRFEIPQWVVRSEAVASVRVQLYQVTPEDYFAYERFESGGRGTPPGKRVHDQTYPVGARRGVNVRVDLRPALGKSGTGHVLAVATTAAAGPRGDEGRAVAWIEVTQLGLVARADGEKLNAWVSDVSPGRFLAARSDAQAALLVEGGAAEPPAVATDASGHVALELAPPVEPRKGRTPQALLVARTATDSAFTSINGHHEKAFRHRSALWYVTDDRFTYKPGEKVYVKGWVRWTHDGVNPDLSLPGPTDGIEYTLKDSAGNKLAGGTLALTAQGGFDVEAALPANVNLGTATFTFTAGAPETSHQHPIAVQEFRTPAYAVDLDDDVSHAGATPLVLGESLEMSASAHYYAGGGLPGAGVVWDATLESTTFRPPGWDGYSFEPIRPRGQFSWSREDLPATTSRREASLSGASAAAIVYGIAALPGNRPGILSVDATVTDVDRMTIRASSRPILVHPSAYYVGLRQRAGDAPLLELVVTDIDGDLVPGVPIDVEIEGVLGSERERADANVTDTQRCRVTSAASPVVCEWKRGGWETAYTARARIADARGRGNGAQYEIPWWSRDDSQDLTLLPDKKLYRPGDVARIEIRSKVLPAAALVTFARNGVIAQQRVELAEASTVVSLPIDVSYLQNVHVLVDRVATKQDPRKGGPPLPLPERRSAEVNLAVDVESARLAMKARALEPLIEPGAEATFEVEVRHDDKPQAGAEVALMVVDEAVLALSTRSYEDPLPEFFRFLQDGTTLFESISLVRDEGADALGKPGVQRYDLDELGRGGTLGHGSGTGSGYGAGGGGLGISGSGVVSARKDFRANAVFSPRLVTDAAGKARVTVKMPDSLTRFRIVAVATADTRNFGKAEGTIVTQRKINARTVAPRFLTQGDRFSLPVVVQNLDRVPRTVDVAVRAANLEQVGPAGKRVTVPGGQRAEVSFDFATRGRGKAVIQTIAASGAFADASNVELPVYEPATTESFATYGTVDDAPKFEELAVPAELFTDVGGVEVELASTQLQSLTDAYWYLYAYPYECAEQRSSRMIATAAMWDLLEAFATGGRPTKAEIDATRVDDARRLARDQLADGGWGYFAGMRSDPFVTVQVLQALGMQKISGPSTKRAIAHVEKLFATSLARLERSARLPASQRKDRAEQPYVVGLAAAALSALATSAGGVGPRAERLHAAAVALDAYPIDAKARLLTLLAGNEHARAIRARLLADLLSATHETAASATVTAAYVEAERLLLVSSTRTTALALQAIMREAPKNALVTKLARGVLDGRRYGRWRSTQENQAALVALREYFDRYEEVTPDYTGKLWLGKAAYAEQAFRGRSGARATARLDWSALAPGSTHELAVAKDGPGRMYYRVGITYAPRRTDLPALDAGFIVRRSYAAVDDPADVTRDGEGRWRVRLGARVLVTIETLNTTRRYGVAVVDPLPAGFEVVNENLATSERAAAHPDDERWDYQNMRDNRAEAFAAELAEGTHRFSYTARATTPGAFLAAPTKAEEMYSPETFGRAAGSVVVVK